jgi:Uma2 family endonuclease
MSTVLKLGPADHGRPMSLDEFLAGDYQEGYKYELIGGRLCVSPVANFPEGHVEKWLYRLLDRYAEEQPEVINYVHNKARVFVPGQDDLTNPEPDIAAYRNVPLDRPLRELRWQDLTPVLVVEVLSPDDPSKDLQRNVDLYLAVPSIKEYWVVDTRQDADEPALIAHIRHGKKWRIKTVAAGDTYTTRLLPGFELLLVPSH